MPVESCDLLCVDLPHAEEVRAGLPGMDDLELPAARAKALSDPRRLRVALALQAGDEMCVCDLAWVCEDSRNLVSHHVRVLRSTGLARSRREGKLVMYELTAMGQLLLDAVTDGRPAAVEA
ncbi:metalloregulator ArsR/SmtB family transcription factor [Klenkia sp. PcliD-1-E]|uniref:ArsR/SmtB family transcription factor n=1 Tax=Klenkia sp. PcliD-1-E TaxID=2954492 RepID=UPI00209739FE|nr:metalloregulator ArsR/SmtB family transcription factor [Klenkia sp. PcliD-1-E]MCO7218300.1 metalloregulator ArsR/SmtB family transcription factor [Klenkia sp. PcliD-1-E]